MKEKCDKLIKTEAEWEAQLGPEAYHIIRQKGTEPPFSGQYDTLFEPGVYRCKACGVDLFESDSKFDAYCGWPAFDKPLETEKIREERDTSNGVVRTEILCKRCGGHLGHVFKDGPTQTGLRYCVNSASLQFEARKEEGGE